MTGLLTEPIERNQALWDVGLDAYPTTFGQDISAIAESTFVTSPLPSLARSYPEDVYDPNSYHYNSPYFKSLREQLQREGKMMTAEEANQRFGIPGRLTFDTPSIPTFLAQQMHERKRAEIERESVLQRSPGGVGRGIAMLGTSFLVSALDPINVASAFIPVVGEARYAIWAERFGATAARSFRGSIEGFVGAAAVEPIVLGQALAEQADYAVADSMLNLVFGTALGGGLHVGLGFIGDLARGVSERPAPHIEAVINAPAATREAALRGSVAALVEDRPVRVGEIFDAFRPQAETRLASLEKQIDRLQENNIAGRHDATIDRLKLDAQPLRTLVSINETIAKMEANNVGGRFNAAIADLREQADILTSNIVERPEALRNAVETAQQVNAAKQVLALHRSALETARAEQAGIAAQIKAAKKEDPLAAVQLTGERAQIRQRIAQSIEPNIAAAKRAVTESPTVPDVSQRPNANPQDILRKIISDTTAVPEHLQAAVDTADAAIAARPLAEPLPKADEADAAAIDEDVTRLKTELTAAVKLKQIPEVTADAIDREFAEIDAESATFSKALKGLATCLIGRT